MNKRSANYWLFFIGLFCWTRVHLVGMIGISELLCLACGPIFFMQDFAKIRRDGAALFFGLTLAVCAGCMISAFYNHAVMAQWARGLATPLVVFCAAATIYHFMDRNPDGIKWLFLGWALSGLITFVIYGGSVAALASDDAQIGNNSASVMRMYLLLPLLYIPIMCWYEKTPRWYSIFGMFLAGAITAFGTASGRSQALILIVAAILFFIGGKSVRKMAGIRKHFVLFLCLGLAFVFVAKTAYSQLASTGVLGEESRAKYYSQTQRGKGILSLLIGGRASSFCALFASLEQPIMGYGPWALDYTGVNERFLAKYGNGEDYKNYMEARLKTNSLMPIETHSHIFGFWLWYGIIGLIFWLYVIKLTVDYFRKYADVVPQWYGLVVVTVTPFFWSVFFSPFSQRVQTASMIVVLLYVRAFAKKKRAMSLGMIQERQKFLP